MNDLIQLIYKLILALKNWKALLKVFLVSALIIFLLFGLGKLMGSSHPEAAPSSDAPAQVQTENPVAK